MPSLICLWRRRFLISCACWTAGQVFWFCLALAPAYLRGYLDVCTAGAHRSSLAAFSAGGVRACRFLICTTYRSGWALSWRISRRARGAKAGVTYRSFLSHDVGAHGVSTLLRRSSRRRAADAAFRLSSEESKNAGWAFAALSAWRASCFASWYR